MFSKESKENGELYGSIKPKEISTAIFEKMKVEVKPSQIVLKNDLNKIGSYKVDVNFHTEVSAQISIKIDKDSGERANQNTLKSFFEYFLQEQVPEY